MVKDRNADAGVSARDLQAWLTSYEGAPIPTAWVPGAKPDERTRLAALGGLVGALMGAGPDASLLPAFSAQDMRRWVTEGPTPPEEFVLRYKKLLASDRRDTTLADLYARTVSPVSRRNLGTFFTAPREVNWMVDQWAASQPKPRAVVDVGAGVGIFTTTAASRWPDAQVWAVDINPVTLGLLALRVHNEYRIESSVSLDPGIRLVLDDYVAWVQETWHDLPSGRLVLGNPPYTRLQLLPHGERARLAAAAGGLCGNRASLSALITAATLQLLQPDDGLCLLLPAQWLESDYAARLRERIWSLKNRRVELHLFASELFDDAQVDAVALLVGTERISEQPFILGHDGNTTRTLPRDSASPDRWRALFEKETKNTAPKRSGFLLRDFAKIKRGVATGDNKFFIVTDATQRERQLPQSVLRPLIRRLRDLPNVCDQRTLDQLEEKHYLLVATERQLKDLKRLQAYIAIGVDEETPERILCQTRPRWYDLNSEIFTPDVIIGPMTKDKFHLVENRAEALITNNLYGLTWKPETPSDMRLDILKWLRSKAGQAAITEAARRQGEGLIKIEPRALNDLPLPAKFRPLADTLL
ncbi:hypothetical protein ACFPJ1_27545 [Kribbella qitaiheensis]|uniref:hypothetical protein n=1 Tax=Kribbella qitaiheensis TaxID=1544730 RepID=UPI003619CF12